MNDIFNNWRAWFPDLLAGYGLSLEITAISLALGLPLGLLLALLVSSKASPVRALALFIVELGRGAPSLIMLQFCYFGLPTVGLTLTSFLSACVGLTIVTGAYASEMIRAGIDAVPQGQKEAAQVVGLNAIDALRFLIVPQAARIALPSLLLFSMQMLQTTSLCFTIAVPELVSRASSIGSETFQYMPVLILAGAFYAVVCIPSTFAVSALERRLSVHTAR